MNEMCHRTRCSLYVALPYRGNSHVSQVPQKEISLSATLPYKGNSYVSQVPQNEISLSVTHLVHRHFLYSVFCKRLFQKRESLCNLGVDICYSLLDTEFLKAGGRGDKICSLLCAKFWLLNANCKKYTLFA